MLRSFAAVQMITVSITVSDYLLTAGGLPSLVCLSSGADSEERVQERYHGGICPTRYHTCDPFRQSASWSAVLPSEIGSTLAAEFAVVSLAGCADGLQANLLPIGQSLVKWQRAIAHPREIEAT